MKEDKQSSETEIVPVSEEAGEPELPVSVVSPDGGSWEPEVPAAVEPEVPAAAEPEVPAAVEPVEDPDAELKARVKVIEEVLEETAKAVAAAVKETVNVEVLILTRDLERAGKSRKTVLKAIRTRLNHLVQAEPAAEIEPEYVAPKVKVSVKGNISEIPGSFWEDGVGNIFVLDNKMGAPSGTFALRLFRRPGG